MNPHQTIFSEPVKATGKSLVQEREFCGFTLQSLKTPDVLKLGLDDAAGELLILHPDQKKESFLDHFHGLIGQINKTICAMCGGTGHVEERCGARTKVFKCLANQRKGLEKLFQHGLKEYDALNEGVQALALNMPISQSLPLKPNTAAAEARLTKLHHLTMRDSEIQDEYDQLLLGEEDDIID